MKKYYLLAFVFLLFAFVIPMAQAATVTISQSGADSGTVMKGNTFTITVSGLSSSGTVNLIDTPTGFSTEEGNTRSFSEGTTSVSWTTASISQTQTGAKIKVSIITTGSETAESGSFNVVLPPSITLSVSPTSVSIDEDSTYTVNLNIQNNGGTKANSVALAVSGTGMSISSGCSAVSSISAGSSSASSCTILASTAGTYTVTFTATPSNADLASDSITVTVSTTSGNETPGGPGSPGGSIGGGNATKKTSKRPELVPGVGLRNNTKLQAALEKVLAKGKMSDQAIDNLIRLSQSIISNLTVNKTLESSTSKSNITVRIKYVGSKKMKNFVVWDKLPKSFAQSSNNITVVAPGSSYEIVEKDPEYVFVYSEIDQNQEIVITYNVNKYVSESALNDTYIEVYAESLEEAAPPEEVICNNNGVCEPDRGETIQNCPNDCVAGAVCTGGDKRCSGNVLEECVSDGSGWSRKEICKYGCSDKQCNPKPIGEFISEMDYTLVIWTIAGIIVILIAATGIYLHKRKKKFGF
jgi:hypothetical protein